MGTIAYKVRKMASPKDGTVKYYAQKTVYKRLTGEDVMDVLVADCQLPRVVAVQAVGAITKSIRNFVLNGHRVNIVGLGSFSAKCNSRGQADRQKVSAEDIKRLSLRFTPSGVLRQAAAQVSFVLADSADNASNQPDPATGGGRG
ncbi:MAG: hypothetical protein ILA34_05940 [Bacteroidaceae bacterium]|nr:hypothetical protein [Bacteroidaceae bacterium]